MNVTSNIVFSPKRADSSPNILIFGTEVQLQSNPSITAAITFNSTLEVNSGITKEGRLVKITTLDVIAHRYGYIYPAMDVVTEKLNQFKSSNLIDGDIQIDIFLDSSEEALTAAQAVGQAFSRFTTKTTEKKVSFTVTVTFQVLNGSQPFYDYIQNIVSSSMYAAQLVDMPTSLLNSTKFCSEAELVVADLNKKGFNSEIEVIRGKELEERGLGGIYGVGKAAEFPPALVILKFLPKNATKTLAVVGKGIVFDTGGLSIKVPPNMCSMKSDMGGAAAVLGSFKSYVLSSNSLPAGKEPINFYGLLCIADNAIGPLSQRPDDIIHMYSGKTVEINNTDAEGRLVLGDGVAYATKNLNPDVVLDIATLTGAALITVGKKHGGLLSNDGDLESALMKMGKNTGDLLFPLLYAPELIFKQARLFRSEVADMKNSVSDRMNAQASAAGHFIEQHLVGEKWDWKRHHGQKAKGLWAHLDIAGPATSSHERGTGFGVALLTEFARCYF